MTPANKDTLLVLGRSVYGCRGECVCVMCVLFRSDSHILAISLSVLTSACDFGAAVTYTEEDTM